MGFDNFKLEAEIVTPTETLGDGFGIDKPAPSEVPAPQKADDAAGGAETTPTDVSVEGDE